MIDFDGCDSAKGTGEGVEPQRLLPVDDRSSIIKFAEGRSQCSLDQGAGQVVGGSSQTAPGEV